MCTRSHNSWVTSLELSVPLLTPYNLPELLGLNFQMPLFVCLFAVTFKSGSRFEGAVDQFLLEIIEISWSSMAYFVVTYNKIHPWRNRGVWSWVHQFKLVLFPFLPFEVLGRCKPWPAQEVRAGVISLTKRLKKLRSLVWSLLMLLFRILRCGVNIMLPIAQEMSDWGKSFCSRAGKMWWDNLGFMWQHARVERQQGTKQADQQNPQDAILCPTKHKFNTYIAASLPNFSHVAWNMWLFGIWGKAVSKIWQ